MAIVQGTTNQGSTWQVLDQYAESGLSYAHHRAFAVDNVHSNLFAGGNLNGVLPDGTTFDALWFIRERNPETLAWSTVDDYSVLDVGQTSCADIMVTPSGDVYATGGGQAGWVVRKRAANASTFTTVYPDSTGQSAGSSWDMAYHPTHGVFVVGDLNGIWTVRRSSTGNQGTWATVDSFYINREWTSGSAKCILATSSKIHVVGSAYNASTRKTHWVVRSSADGGLTWSITDMALTGSNVEARGIVEDADRNLIVCGQVAGTAGDLRWIVRKGTPGTKQVKQGGKWVTIATMTWTTSDDFQLVPGKPAQPNAITTSNGNIYVSGRAQDANGVDQFIVRKLAAQ